MNMGFTLFMLAFVTVKFSLTHMKREIMKLFNINITLVWHCGWDAETCHDTKVFGKHLLLWLEAKLILSHNYRMKNL